MSFFCLGMEKVESKHDEITLEFDFQWIGDPNIVLVVQTMAGNILPVQVSQFFVACMHLHMPMCLK